MQTHLPLHLEYRSWSPHRRAGIGISMQHRHNSGEKEEDIDATLSLDYGRPNEIEDVRVVLVCYDHDQMRLWTLPMSQKKMLNRRSSSELMISWANPATLECR